MQIEIGKSCIVIHMLYKTNFKKVLKFDFNYENMC